MGIGFRSLLANQSALTPGQNFSSAMCPPVRPDPRLGANRFSTSQCSSHRSSTRHRSTELRTSISILRSNTSSEINCDEQPRQQ